MRDVLIDVRCLQDPESAATAAGRAAWALLRGARAGLPGDSLVGLIDPRLPVPAALRRLLDRVRGNGYTGASRRPTCLVRLGPPGRDTLALARPLHHPAIPSATVALAAGRSCEPRFDRVLVADATFWPQVRALRPPCAPAVVRGARARMALVTGGREDRAWRAGLRALVDLDVFAIGPGHPLGALPLLSPRYDRVLSCVANVAGNAHLVAAVSRFGGAALVRDPCLLAVYGERPRRLAGLAEAELGRALGPGEAGRWQRGEVRPPVSLLGSVAAAAEPLLLHAGAAAAQVRDRLGGAAAAVPMPIARPATRPLARRRGPLQVQVVAGGLAAEACVWAWETLRSWGVEVRLRFAGGLTPALASLSAALGGVDGEPAEVLVALAMRGQGIVGGPVPAAAAAGRACVASAWLADSWEAPRWVLRVPDEPSPILIAEAILRAREAAPGADELGAFQEQHDPARCARLLCEALELAA